jgi:hypothetical protein
MSPAKSVYIVILPMVLALGCSPDKPCISSYEILPPNDTFNVIDCKGRKQGHWIVTEPAATHKVRTYYTNSASDTTLRQREDSVEMVKKEEGFYKDDKKESLWKFFHADGSVKSTLEYKNGEPAGR